MSLQTVFRSRAVVAAAAALAGLLTAAGVGYVHAQTAPPAQVLRAGVDKNGNMTLVQGTAA